VGQFFSCCNVLQLLTLEAATWKRLLETAFLCRPLKRGLDLFIEAYPALPRWLPLFRAFGAGVVTNCPNPNTKQSCD
jgi:hypothetical protein